MKFNYFLHVLFFFILFSLIGNSFGGVSDPSTDEGLKEFYDLYDNDTHIFFEKNKSPVIQALKNLRDTAKKEQMILDELIQGHKEIKTNEFIEKEIVKHKIRENLGYLSYPYIDSVGKLNSCLPKERKKDEYTPKERKRERYKNFEEFKESWFKYISEAADTFDSQIETIKTLRNAEHSICASYGYSMYLPHNEKVVGCCYYNKKFAPFAYYLHDFIKQKEIEIEKIENGQLEYFDPRDLAYLLLHFKLNLSPTSQSNTLNLSAKSQPSTLQKFLHKLRTVRYRIWH